MLKDARKLEFEKRAEEMKVQPLDANGYMDAIRTGVYSSDKFNTLSDIVAKVRRFLPLLNISLHRDYPILGDELPSDYGQRLITAFRENYPKPHNYVWDSSKAINDAWDAHVRSMARDSSI